MTSSLAARFLKHIRAQGLILPRQRILVAFSGGRDSVCLLHLFYELKSLFDLSLAACHVHHGLRGAEAERDLAFCRSFCSERDICLYEARVDVPAFCREHRMGTEEGARLLRYEALRKIKRENAFDCIAVAHHADDQAETVLFHLLRGSGMAGARGMEARQEDLIRPLLPFTEKEICTYLATFSLPFTQDSTNDDTIYARNRIRHELLPLMEAVHPNARRALAAFAAHAGRQEALTNRCAALWEKEHGLCADERKIPLHALNALVRDEALSPVLYRILSQMAASEKIVIDFERFDAICRLLKQPNEGKIIEIERGFCFFISESALCFGTHESKKDGIEYKIELPFEKKITTPYGTRLSVLPYGTDNGVNINKKCLIIPFSSDRMKGSLYLRSPKNGDHVLTAGMHKNARELWRSEGIPQDKRSQIPVICDEDGIFILPPHTLCDKAKGHADHCLCIEDL